MSEDQNAKVVTIAEEDHYWHQTLHQAVLGFIYAREAFRRYPSEADALARAEEALYQASTSPSERRRREQLLEELRREAEQGAV